MGIIKPNAPRCILTIKLGIYMDDNNIPAKQDESRDELGRFKKGYSGNPNGRQPRELTIPDILREVLDEEVDGKTRMNIIMKRVVQKAYEGERWAVEFIANRLEGTPKQTIDQNVNNTNPVFIVKDKATKEILENLDEL